MVYMSMNLRGLLASIIIVSLLSSIFIINDTPRDSVTEFIKGGINVTYWTSTGPVNITSRSIIYNYIQNNPGAHLRGISSALSISIGSAQYHLERMVNGELLEAEKDSKYKRFYIARRFSEIEKRIIALLNRPTTRRIIKKIQQRGEVQHQELASLLGVTSQAITWQVKLLKDQDIITPNEKHGTICYTLTREACAVLVDLEREHAVARRI